MLFTTGAAAFNTCKAGTVPVTDIFTLYEGVAGSFDRIVIEPVFTPAAAGVPVTVNVALPAAAIAPAGVTAVTVNPVVGVTDVIVNGAEPVFLIVNV